MDNLASFAELDLFNLRASMLCTDYPTAHNALYNDGLVYSVASKFFAKLVERCNVYEQAVAPPSASSRLQTTRRNMSFNSQQTNDLLRAGPYVVATDNLLEAFIVSQFGPRVFPDIGPAEDIERRLVQASNAFTSLVANTLTICGVTERSSLASMPEPLVSCVRFMIVELNEARVAYLRADRCNRYTIVARTLDRLYEAVEDENTDARHRLEFQGRIESMRGLMRDVDMLRYDIARLGRASR